MGSGLFSGQAASHFIILSCLRKRELWGLLDDPEAVQTWEAGSQTWLGKGLSLLKRGSCCLGPGRRLRLGTARCCYYGAFFLPQFMEVLLQAQHTCEWVEVIVVLNPVPSG